MDRREKARQMRAEGKKLKEIAAELGVTAERARQLLFTEEQRDKQRKGLREYAKTPEQRKRRKAYLKGRRAKGIKPKPPTPIKAIKKCPTCGGPVPFHAKYCTVECRPSYCRTSYRISTRKVTFVKQPGADCFP